MGAPLTRRGASPFSPPRPLSIRYRSHLRGSSRDLGCTGQGAILGPQRAIPSYKCSNPTDPSNVSFYQRSQLFRGAGALWGRIRRRFSVCSSFGLAFVSLLGSILCSQVLHPFYAVIADALFPLVHIASVSGVIPGTRALFDSVLSRPSKEIAFVIGRLGPAKIVPGDPSIVTQRWDTLSTREYAYRFSK